MNGIPSLRRVWGSRHVPGPEDVETWIDDLMDALVRPLTEEEKNLIILSPESASLGGVVSALNAIGVSPRDLITVFQAIKAAGALQAELEII